MGNAERWFQHLVVGLSISKWLECAFVPQRPSCLCCTSGLESPSPSPCVGGSRALCGSACWEAREDCLRAEESVEQFLACMDHMACQLNGPKLLPSRQSRAVGGPGPGQSLLSGCALERLPMHPVWLLVLSC